MDLNLQKSRSAGTGAAPVLAVQVDQLVLAVASVLESDGLSLVQQRLYLKVIAFFQSLALEQTRRFDH